MKTRTLYLLLCMIGIALPYSELLPWLAANGFDLALLLHEITSSQIAAFGWLDVIVSALALFLFAFNDGRRQRAPLRWLPLVATLAVGVSLGLPLYLSLRERTADLSFAT